MSRSPEFDPSMKNSSPEAGEVPVQARFNLEEINIFPAPKSHIEYIEQSKRMDTKLEQDKDPDYEGMIERGRERLRKAIVEEKDPWEPFNQEPRNGQRFINLYNGPYSEQMEFNREKSERLLEVAGIEGKVVIVDVPRDRSAGGASITSVNFDGSTSAGKFKSAEKQKSVKSAPEGWRIEIPGEYILDNLARKDLRKELSQKFTVEINREIRSCISEILIKAKITEPRYRNIKAIGSTFPYAVSYLIYSVLYGEPVWFSLPIGTLMQGAANFIRKNEPEFTHHINRTLKEPIDYIMPFIEVDRFLRGIAYSRIKGRNLVRLKKD